MQFELCAVISGAISRRGSQAVPTLIPSPQSIKEDSMKISRLLAGLVLLVFPAMAQQVSQQVRISDANRAQDEAAIRKLIADHNAAFNRHDGSGIVYFTDDADTRNIVGEFFTGKAEIEKLDVVLNKHWANV